jgi:hypothetical protein
MDFVKNAMHNNQGQPAAQGAAGPQAGGVQKEDYVDKGKYFFPLTVCSHTDKGERMDG